MEPRMAVLWLITVLLTDSMVISVIVYILKGQGQGQGRSLINLHIQCSTIP